MTDRDKHHDENALRTQVRHRLNRAGRTLLSQPETGYMPRAEKPDLAILALAIAGRSDARPFPTVGGTKAQQAIAQMNDDFALLRHIPQRHAVLRHIVATSSLVAPDTNAPLYTAGDIAPMLGLSPDAIRKLYRIGINTIAKALVEHAKP